MPKHEWTAGETRLLDNGSSALNTGWKEPSPGSDVTRTGNQVHVSMLLKNVAQAAYSATPAYVKGEMVTETGVTYISIADANKGHTPSTDAGVHWAVVAAPTTVTTLAPEYRPAAATVTPDGKFKIATTGVVTSTFSLATEAETALNISYRAATLTP